MRIVTLMENTASSPEFFAEHGLSLYIETNGRKVLFDFGQTDAFLHNAALLGIDLAAVDTAVLSHGHYDHGGGLKAFLSVNQKADVFMSSHAFEPHCNGTEKYIGLDLSLRENKRIHFIENRVDLGDGLLLHTDIPLRYPIEPFGLTMEGFAPEDFRHEIYLTVREGEKTVLFSGCSHRGILNIIPEFMPDIAVGGFHYSKLKAETGGRLESAAGELCGYPTRYFTCHCTGEEQYRFMKKFMGEKLQYLSSGDVIEL